MIGAADITASDMIVQQQQEAKLKAQELELLHRTEHLLIMDAKVRVRCFLHRV
jgi:hypothetical protein